MWLKIIIALEIIVDTVFLHKQSGTVNRTRGGLADNKLVLEPADRIRVYAVRRFDDIIVYSTAVTRVDYVYLIILRQASIHIKLMIDKQDNLFIYGNIKLVRFPTVKIINDIYVKVVVLTDTQVLVVILRIELQNELDAVVDEF